MRTELALSLALALAAGALVGLERQQAIARNEGKAVLLGGVRTFPLLSLAGALCMLLLPVAGAWILGLGLMGVVALAVAHRLGPGPLEPEAGITTETAAVVTFLLGALAGGPADGPLGGMADKSIAVAGLAIVTTLLLSIKPRLHAIVRHISEEDILAALQLLLVAVVVLPLLPDRDIGPVAGFNPRHVGQMVALIGGVSFVGYALSRFLGTERGLVLTGLVGGLVSSTAVTFTMARRAKEEPALVATCALSTVAACSVMLIRMALIVGVIAPALLPRLAVVLVAMALGGVVAGRRVFKSARAEHHTVGSVQLKNPFELKSALTFGLLFSIVIVGTRALHKAFGNAALIGAALIAGTTDVDAITLSTATLAKGGLDTGLAVGVIFGAVCSNTLVKGVAAWWIAGRNLGRALGRVLLAMSAGGLVAVGALALFG